MCPPGKYISNYKVMCSRNTVVSCWYYYLRLRSWEIFVTFIVCQTDGLCAIFTFKQTRSGLHNAQPWDHLSVFCMWSFCLKKFRFPIKRLFLTNYKLSWNRWEVSSRSFMRFPVKKSSFSNKLEGFQKWRNIAYLYFVSCPSIFCELTR